MSDFEDISDNPPEIEKGKRDTFGNQGKKIKTIWVYQKQIFIQGTVAAKHLQL